LIVIVLQCIQRANEEGHFRYTTVPFEPFSD